jgi:hypothetical protein
MVASATIAPEESLTTPAMLVELAACAWSDVGHSANKQSNAASIATNWILEEELKDTDRD